MAILVVCQSCKTRFQVSEKFAGKQGPCPKCKAVITIPKLEEQVKIHAPDEYAGGGAVAAKDATGRAVLKPLAREKPKLQPIIVVAASAGVLVTLIVAFLLRGTNPSIWILGAGAILLAPPIVVAGYFAMRDAESEPYRGTALWLRVGIVSAVYAGLWGIAALFSAFVFADSAPELWQLIPPAAIMVVGGTIAAMATVDLEPLNGFFHYAFYLLVTVLLRLVIGLAPLGGQAVETTAAAARTAIVWVAHPVRACAVVGWAATRHQAESVAWCPAVVRLRGSQRAAEAHAYGESISIQRHSAERVGLADSVHLTRA